MGADHRGRGFTSRSPQEAHQQLATPEAVLEATVSVAWERPVHAARLAFLRRMAQPGQVSVQVACGTDRLGFIDAACGLTTILTDSEAAACDIQAYQCAELEARVGRLAGRVEIRQLAVEALASAEGFPPGSVHHVTLLNLFNAHLCPPADYPRLVNPLLTIVAPGGSVLLTDSEAAVLLRQAQARQMHLIKRAEMQGYYDENVVLFQLSPLTK